MTTLNQIVDEVLLNLTSYGLIQPRVTTLSGDIDDNDTTIAVTSVANVPTGLVEIDDELLLVQSKDLTANTLSVIRGYRTTAAAHTSGALVTVSPPWPRQQVKNAINDAISSSYPSLYKVATSDLTVSGSDNTYTLTGANKVLNVSYLSLGPFTEHIQVKRYRYDTNQNQLTIYQRMIVGQPLHVVYTAPPTTLTAGTDLLTASGLQQSAKAYVVLAATAQLVIHMDGSRLPSNSAMADDMEPNRSVGSATQIAKVLISRAEMELERERKRLQQQYPPTINIARG